MGFLLIACGGVVTDYGRAQVAQSRMQSALDAATLAAAKHIPDPPVAQTEVRSYFDTNYNDFMDTNILNFTAEVANGDTLNTTAEGEIQTYIMRIFGIETMQFAVDAAVELMVQETEVVFVLDNTGSMNAANMPVLKTSMTGFLNNFFANPLMNGNFNVGLVPFSNSVNIGLNRADWTENDTYFWGPATWQGCVIARYENNRDITDDPPNVQRFMKYYWPCHDDRTNRGPSPGVERPNLWHGTDGAAQNCEATGAVNFSPVLGAEFGPSRDCETLHPVVPMTSQRNVLVNAINALQGIGSTQITTGLAWGWNMLSPRWRGLWGGEMNTKNLPQDYSTGQVTNKHMIVVSDGANLLFTAYSAYGRLSEGNLGFTARLDAEAEVNRRTLELCRRIKTSGIRLYTIALGADMTPESLDMLEECASSPNDFFATPSDANVLTRVLSKVQENIAGDAVAIRLVR